MFSVKQLYRSRQRFLNISDLLLLPLLDFYYDFEKDVKTVERKTEENKNGRVNGKFI